MNNAQPGILAPVSRFSRFLFFDLAEGRSAASALSRIASCVADADLVLGIGRPLVAGTGHLDGLTTFPAMAGAGVSVPSTQKAVWCWLRNETDWGELVHQSAPGKWPIPPPPGRGPRRFSPAPCCRAGDRRCRSWRPGRP